MEILPTVPDELFSDSFTTGALGLDDESACGAGQQDITSTAIASVVDDIIDNVIFGFSLEIHRMCKKGVLFLEDTDSESIEKFKIVDAPGLDIFGQELKKSTLECVCPNCDRLMAASRFAPHLEKCMGMGRSSSRVASRRIANNITKHEGSDNDSLVGDNEHDNDWGPSFKRSKKLKKEKQNTALRGRGRPPTKPRTLLVEPANELDSSSVTENMDDEERNTVFGNFCVAFTDRINKKLCARSIRCNVHTDEMRQAARQILLGEVRRSEVSVGKNQSKSMAGPQPDDDIDVDIDTYDDTDSQTLRDTIIWDKELTPTPSPADSTSTINSTGSRKRGRKKKSKRRD